jgi:two-component system, sensor histidine kinase YesM
MLFRRIFLSTSIKNKIFVLNSAIILGCIITIAIFCNVILREAIINKEIVSSGRELELIKNSLSVLFADVEEYSKILSTDISLQKSLTAIKDGNISMIERIQLKREIARSISKILQPNTKIIKAVAIDSYGQVINDDSIYDIHKIYEIMDMNTLNEVRNLQVPVWLGLYRIEMYNSIINDCFILAKSVTNIETGINIGTVLLFLKENDVAAVFSNQTYRSEDLIYILDKNQIILSTNDKNQIYQEFSEVSVITDRELSSIANKSFVSAGHLYFLALCRFQILDLDILQIKSLGHAMSESKKITDLITVIGVICLVFAFAGAYALSNTITKPLLILSKKMDEVSGDCLELFEEPIFQNEIGLLTSGYNRLITRVRSLMDSIYVEQRSKRRYEFRILQSQINPHFLYNTIETIISFIKIGMNTDAIETGRYLADFYRFSLSNGKEFITVREEIKLIENYLLIQKKRYINVFDFAFLIEDEIMDCKVLKLTLQPLVENAIYHGLKHKRQKGLIIIKGYADDDRYIVFEVFDNGVGISEHKIRDIFANHLEDEKSEGFGLFSVNERIRLVYGDMYGLKIESQIGEYTKVIVKFPLK